MIVASISIKRPKSFYKVAWTDEQRRVLLNANGELTLKELAKLTRKPESSVKTQCHKLGIKYKGSRK